MKLCTIWIRRFYLHANLARFHRERKPSSHSHPFNANERNSLGSYVSTLKLSKTNNVMSDQVLPSLILDDSCISNRNFSLSLMGKVKDITVMPNLYWVRAKEMEACDLIICNDSYESESSDDKEDAKDNISSIGNSGGILCVWDPTLFVKDNVTSSNNFLDVMGTWVPSSSKLLIISAYAPQDLTEKKVLWDYILHLIDRWDGDSSLIDIPLDGYAYNWAHKTTNKTSKLDRFLVFKGLLVSFPYLLALCLDRNLSDHRLILIRELSIDYGFTPFRFFHSWFNLDGFDKIIEDTWKSLATVDSNGVINLKKLQALKIVIK
ncbi:hypothetical protein Tco_0670820 [Tanacetum coccineum]